MCRVVALVIPLLELCFLFVVPWRMSAPCRLLSYCQKYGYEGGELRAGAVTMVTTLQQ